MKIKPMKMLWYADALNFKDMGDQYRPCLQCLAGELSQKAMINLSCWTEFILMSSCMTILRIDLSLRQILLLNSFQNKRLRALIK